MLEAISFIIYIPDHYLHFLVFSDKLQLLEMVSVTHKSINDFWIS